MSDAVMTGPKVMGWCPGALRPMMSGDGLVVRIRARAGRLGAAEVAGIARASRAYGNGILDLSARANLQIRGVAPVDHPKLICDLSDLGLIDPDAAAETRRNILVTPFWTPGDGTIAVADGLCQLLENAASLNLPAKFGFSIDRAGNGAALRDASADIRIELGLDGAWIFADRAGTAAYVSHAQAAETAMALAHWFVDQGGVIDGRGRMAALLARGATLPHAFRSHPIARTAMPPARPGRVEGLGVLVGLEFGQISAETLLALADHAPALRLTPWRMVLCETDLPPDLPGLILDPASPLLRVTACTGAPSCLQAHQETRAIARALAPLVTCGLHVSGCAKGCAHPGAAPLTLTASPQGYDLGLNGKAGDSPVETGLPPDLKTLTESVVHHATFL